MTKDWLASIERQLFNPCWVEAVDDGVRASDAADTHVSRTDAERYVAGGTDFGWARHIETHLAWCNSCLSRLAEAAASEALGRALAGNPCWPRIGLSEARGATREFRDGHTHDKLLRWNVTEDDSRNARIRVSSEDLDLEGRRIVFGASGLAKAAWSREAILRVEPRGAGYHQVGAEVVITTNERRRFKGDTVLTLELVDAPAHNPVSAARVAEDLAHKETRKHLTRMVSKWIFRALPDVADELVQDFTVNRFIPIARNFDPGRFPEGFRHYIVTCFHNYCVSAGKKIATSRQRNVSLHEVVDKGWNPPDLNACPESLARMRTLSALLERLPARDRRLLALRYEEDMTTREISALEDRPEGSVKAWISHAQRRLKYSLELLTASDVLPVLRAIADEEARLRPLITPETEGRLVDLIRSSAEAYTHALAAIAVVEAIGSSQSTERMVAALAEVSQAGGRPSHLRDAANKTLMKLRNRESA